MKNEQFSARGNDLPRPAGNWVDGDGSVASTRYFKPSARPSMRRREVDEVVDEGERAVIGKPGHGLRKAVETAKRAWRVGNRHAFR
jgi:hypothetical protein